MIINILSEQYDRLFENSFDEARRNIPKNVQKDVYQASQDLAKEVYGDDFGNDNEYVSKAFKIPDYKDDADIKGGLFSVGNEKLSPDTLIINFTSAFGCPSAKDCPITQAACYAVASENRLKDVRNKNKKVERLLARCSSANKLDKFFDIAELYIKRLEDSSKPIKWIRFNEAGDFPNQKVLDAATDFAEKVEKLYGVKSMAYTAKSGLDFSRASRTFSINASTLDVLKSFDPSATRRNFFGIGRENFEYNFIEDEYKAKGLLNKNWRTQEVPMKVIDGVRYNGVVEGDITTPYLAYGRWGSGEEEQGYYYVCPCSFWKDEKNKVEYPYCQEHLNEPPFNIKHLRAVYGKDSSVVKTLESQLNKIQSPCGIKCAVCHDRNGGILKGSNDTTRIKDYAVLTAIHGPNSSKFNPLYARLKRLGKDVKWSEQNPYGLFRNNGGVGKYGKIPTAPNKK